MERYSYLQHFGIKGQKWGLRRFQNEDGTLTAEGKERYGDPKADRKAQKAAAKERYRRGKELSKEHDEVFRKKHKELDDKDEDIVNLRKQREEIKNRRDQYALNRYKRGEDFDYDDDDDYFNRELQKKDNVIDYFSEKNKVKAQQRADRFISKKHGKDALSDIEYYKEESEKKFNRALAIGTISTVALVSWALFRK